MFWNGKRVLVTGHTGFKGGWLSLWLNSMGAKVYGYSLPPPTDPSLYVSANLSQIINGTEGDVRDAEKLARDVETVKPDVVFHLAAQSLVRPSYADPVGTYATNVMGTVNLLEAVRRSDSVRVAIIVTSDKCYENRGVVWGYRETDPMGGHDPYSSSKGCAELVAASYRRSFFGGESAPALATVRAGNVIGGGDWAEYRLVPDCIRALFKDGRILIRQPRSVRPWQHVLEPLSGYLLLAERLWSVRDPALANVNFGPYAQDAQPVADLVQKIIKLWGSGRWEDVGSGALHEAGFLMLDCSLARHHLGWRPQLSFDEGLSLTVEWYRRFREGARMDEVTLQQISQYERAEVLQP
jgi:CDP-glucose 4,6-dehydratase